MKSIYNAEKQIISVEEHVNRLKGIYDAVKEIIYQDTEDTFALIQEEYQSVFNQIYFLNIEDYTRSWEIVGKDIVESVKLYFLHASQNVRKIQIYENTLWLVYIITKNFGFCPEEVREFLCEIEEYKDQAIRDKITRFSLKDTTKMIGIYGSGKHAEFILNYYQENIGKISANYVFLDSYQESYVEKKNGIDIVNICDATALDLDEVIILSHLYEEEMYAKARAVLDETIPIITMRQNDKYAFSLDKRCIYKDGIELLPDMVEKRIVLINIPNHTNIGDYMITFAEEMFIKKYFPEYKLIKFSGAEYARNHKIVCSQIRKSDVVCITGGGFLGNLWFSGSNVNTILEDFRYNKVIIFPQSIYFKEDEDKQKQIEVLYKNLLMCVDVRLILREKKSFDYANEIFHRQVKTYLMPDIVLSLEKCEKGITRSGVLLCLRKDQESVISEESKLAIADKMKKVSNSVSDTTMHWHEIIDDATKEDVIEQKLQEFRSARLVVTDTLHAMISCVITGTPCISINNLTGKVKGVYKWIEDLGYVKCFDTAEEFLLEDISKWDALDGAYKYSSIFKEYEIVLEDLIIK